jgi:competence protein ComEC
MSIRASSLALTTMLASFPLLAQVDITLIDVNQGDAILVTFPPLVDGSRRRMLIDGGDSASANSELMQFLSDQQIDALDWVVLTHPHSDHFNGLTKVLGEITVRELWTTGESRTCSNPNCEWNPFVSARANAEIDRVPERGLTRSSQGAKFEVLMVGGNHSDTDDGPDINNDSLSIMLSYEGVKVLFTGDIEGDGGNDLVNAYCGRARNRCRKLDVDIIKIPHHGSSHLSATFVKFAAAEIGLVSAGPRNRQHHHPRTVALDTYRELGMTELYSTSTDTVDHITIRIDEDGDIIRPSFPAGQTYSAWESSEPDRDCASGEVHEALCLVLVPQGTLP